MRFSELARKELLDINEGNFWGTAGRADLLINEQTGEIHSLVLGGSGGFLGIGQSDEIIVPWKAIIKIGGDAIIFDFKKK
jgi:YlmC/YmxH family sporulation protein